MIRRRFVIGGLAGLAGIAAKRLHSQGEPVRAHSLGVQLYTLRELAEKDLAKTLASVAAIGYREIEFAGYFGHPAPLVRRMLDDNGLVSPSAHVSMENLGTTWEASLADANILGQQYLTCAWIDARHRTAIGYGHVAEQFNKAGLTARSANIHFAYHNHAYEFDALAGGASGLEILVAECEPANLALQADLFWMRAAGQDPLEWFARHPGRFHMAHAKDMGPAPKNEMVDVGKGTTDWPKLISAARKAGIKHFFVEHDEPKDALASIRASYNYLTSIDAL